MVDLKEFFSKPAQNILSPEIINKEKIKTNTFKTTVLKRKSVTIKTQWIKNSLWKMKRAINRGILHFTYIFATKISTRKICSTKLPVSQKLEFCRFMNKIRRNRSNDRFRLFVEICIWEVEMWYRRWTKRDWQGFWLCFMWSFCECWRY